MAVGADEGADLEAIHYDGQSQCFVFVVVRTVLPFLHPEFVFCLAESAHATMTGHAGSHIGRMRVICVGFVGLSEIRLRTHNLFFFWHF
jgi:hypothetical protein